jgi:hypothetical protein
MPHRGLPGVNNPWIARRRQIGWLDSKLVGSAHPRLGRNLAEQPVLHQHGASSGVMSGNTYTMNLAVTFQAGFAGAKGVFGYVL